MICHSPYRRSGLPFLIVRFSNAITSRDINRQRHHCPSRLARRAIAAVVVGLWAGWSGYSLNGRLVRQASVHQAHLALYQLIASNRRVLNALSSCLKTSWISSLSSCSFVNELGHYLTRWTFKFCFNEQLSYIRRARIRISLTMFD